MIEEFEIKARHLLEIMYTPSKAFMWLDVSALGRRMITTAQLDFSVVMEPIFLGPPVELGLTTAAQALDIQPLSRSAHR